MTLIRTLASIEAEQLRSNDIQNLKSQFEGGAPTGNQDQINQMKEKINEVQKQREFNQFREQSIPPTVVGANAAPTSPTSTAGSPVVGSSIAGKSDTESCRRQRVYILATLMRR